MSRIRNIIFDLGGVLLHLNMKKTNEEFTALGVKDFEKYFTMVHADPLFKRLETGKVGNEFYEGVRKTTSIKASDEQIDAAWNAMLLDFSEEAVRKLQQLSWKYHLFLFSNTNAIHHAFFQKAFRKQFGFDMDLLFEKAWYSHVAGHRKPDLTAFEYIIKDSGVDPRETVFIDDTLPNVETARKAGLKAAHLTPPKTVVELLDELLSEAAKS